jgi:hypothetical protein
VRALVVDDDTSLVRAVVGCMRYEGYTADTRRRRDRQIALAIEESIVLSGKGWLSCQR